jgi:hypothetical protein
MRRDQRTRYRGVLPCTFPNCIQGGEPADLQWTTFVTRITMLQDGGGSIMKATTVSRQQMLASVPVVAA